MVNDRTQKNAMLAAAGLVGYLAGRSLLRSARETDLEGKVVVITGGSRGLGLLLARECAEQGAKVAICARDMRELERSDQILRRYTNDILPMRCDVSHYDDVKRFIASVRDRFGRIDAVINNAGVIQVGPIEEMTLDDFEEAMRIHFWGSLYMIWEVMSEMRARRDGHIVNITSIGGRVSVPHLVPYNASKFALVGLSEGLRAELMQHNVKVTTIVPGLMRTGSHVNAYFKGKHQDEFALFSILGGNSLMSMNADRAARLIVDAMKRGDAKLTLTIQARAIEKLHGVFPGLTSSALGVAARALPKPGGIGKSRRKGSQSRGKEIRPATFQADRATMKNNELPPGTRP